MPSARRFPPPWSIRRLGYGLLIGLAFPGYLIWHLAKYGSAEGGRPVGKIGRVHYLFAVFRLWRSCWDRPLGFDPGPVWESAPRTLKKTTAPGQNPKGLSKQLR